MICTRQVLTAVLHRAYIRPRTLTMASTPINRICVFAPTDTELRHAEDHFRQRAPLTAPTPPSTTPGATASASPEAADCDLHFHSQQTWQGTVNESSPNESASSCGSLDVGRFFSLLDTTSLGRVLFTASATPSTQSIIQENAAKLPNGVLFVADKQMGGKGRGGNIWESPAGCLMFSACQRLTIEGQRLPFVQYLVTLAVVQAVQAEASVILGLDTTIVKEAAPLPIGIKWPNDIYSDGLKLGGILCHSSFREGQFHVIMGVGLNLSNRSPTTCVDALIEAEALRRSLSSTAAAGAPPAAPPPPPISKEAVLARTMTFLEPMLQRLSAEGFAPFESEYYSAWLHSEQAVVLDESVDGIESKVHVAVKGLSAHGYLLAVDEAGERYELHPDGNSLDFFKGLVRKKL